MTDPEKNHVAVRLDAATLARIDALAPLLSSASSAATRSEVLRALLLTALEDAEKAPEEFKARHLTRHTT
jgi:hypothetical protein